MGPLDTEYAPKEREKVMLRKKAKRRKARTSGRRNSQRMVHPEYSNRGRRLETLMAHCKWKYPKLRHRWIHPKLMRRKWIQGAWCGAITH